MLLKSADDKSKRLRLLEELQESPLLDAAQRDWLQKELDRLRKGTQGEKAAAHYLDNYLASSKNNLLMHDLRFEVDGEVAQIDHLLLTRAAGIMLFETKNFSGNLRINEHGEFSVNYGAREYGVPSPLEQSRRHANVLKKLLVRLEIAPRVGNQMEFHHIVLVDPKATITRPPAKAFDSSMVIKADLFPEWHKRFVDVEVGVLDLVKGLANVRSADTLREWGEKLLREHRPVHLVKLPDFMAPNASQATAPAPAHVVVTGAATSIVPAPPPAAVPEPTEPPIRKLICAHFGAKITFAEGKFCWNNVTRFGGLQYCREHQKLFK
jgi:hypothetical protein